jgi:hypothetical protein
VTQREPFYPRKQASEDKSTDSDALSNDPAQSSNRSIHAYSGSSDTRTMSFSKSALPTPQELEAARQVPVHDAQGKQVLLGSLFEPDQIGGTAVVVFIRHFLCGLCECC